MSLNKKWWIDKTSSLVLITGLIIFIIYSPTVLFELPFFKISHLEINVKNGHLKEIVKNVIEKKYQSNWLLLKLNMEKFNQLLREYSQFYIEKAQVDSFSFINGNLKMQLNLNQPLFVINNEYFLAKNGRIFKTDIYSLKDFPSIVDKNSKWTLGDIYNRSILKQLINLNNVLKPAQIIVDKYAVVIESKKVKSVIPYEKLASIKTVKELQKQYYEYKLYLNLLGKKSFAVKIFRE